MSVKKHFYNTNLYFTILTLVFFLSIFAVFDIWKSEAASNDSKRKTANPAKEKLSTDIKLSNFQVEKFSDGVKIYWQTSFEKNILGYRVWRENGGKKQLINAEIIGGSLVKTANGLLENGSEYSISDGAGSEQNFYRLEAVDANGKSVWFGRFDVHSGNNLNVGLPKNIMPTGLIGQTNRVDLAPKTDDKSAKKNLWEGFANPANDASAIKFNVKKNGWHRIEAADFRQFGIEKGLSDNWKLFSDGIEQPLKINDDGSVEFYGRGIDTFYSDTRVYWLTKSAGIGKKVNRTARTFNESAQDGWSRTIAEKKDRVIRASGILNGERENWYGGIVYSVVLNQTLNLNEIAVESGETATLSVDLQGTGGVQHRVSVILNGTEIGQIAFNYTDRKEWSINLPLSNFVEGANTISLGSSASSDISFLEAVRISYPRRYKAENNQLNFQVNAGQSAKLKGFTSPNVRIFDLTNHENISESAPESRLETDGTYTVTLDSAPTERVLLAQTESVELHRANPLILNSPSDWRNTANGAKFIIIARSEVFEQLRGLENRREAEGLPTEIVDIADVYDEFNHGVKNPAAIREFLRYAKESWTIKPEYVLIAGDASVDPRNYSGLGGDAKDVISTLFVDTWNLEAVADEMLVDFDGDSIGELAIGRLPYQTPQELNAMLSKIYSINAMPLSEINSRGVVFISDAPQGYNFAAASRNIASLIPASVVSGYIDRGSQDSTVVKNAIMAKINSGAIFVSYFGHGHVYNWTNGNILRNTDAPNMQNIQNPSMMAMIACLNGAFAETNLESLAEAVMKTQTGGAFAVWSASASNTADAQELLAKEYNLRVFSGMRLGDAARETKMTTYIPDIRRTYVFFGDPTQRIVAP